MISLANYYIKTKKVMLFYAIALMISGCGSVQKEVKKPAVIPQKTETEPSQVITPAIDLKGLKLTREITQMEAQISKSTDLSFQSKAHLRLAMLYLHNNNPAPQYTAALKELELYVSIDGDGAKRIEIQVLIRALRELARVNDDNRKLKAKIDQLAKENSEIKKTFEDLKSLDLKMEEKRRQVK